MNLQLIYLLTVVHVTVSSPVKEEQIEKNSKLLIETVGSEAKLNPLSGEIRSKRQLNQIPFIDTTNRSQRQLLPDPPNNEPELPVNHYLTTRGLEEIGPTLETILTSSNSNSEMENDVTTRSIPKVAGFSSTVNDYVPTQDPLGTTPPTLPTVLPFVSSPTTLPSTSPTTSTTTLPPTTFTSSTTQSSTSISTSSPTTQISTVAPTSPSILSDKNIILITSATKFLNTKFPVQEKDEEAASPKNSDEEKTINESPPSTPSTLSTPTGPTTPTTASTPTAPTTTTTATTTTATETAATAAKATTEATAEQATTAATAAQATTAGTAAQATTAGTATKATTTTKATTAAVATKATTLASPIKEKTEPTATTLASPIEGKTEPTTTTTVMPTKATTAATAPTTTRAIGTKGTTKTTETRPTTVTTRRTPVGISKYRPLYPYLPKNASSLQLTDKKANCDFGRDDDLTLCEWKNMNLSLEKWIPSKGENYIRLGGPPEDNTLETNQGGYGLYDTCKTVDNQFPQTLAFDSAMLISPVLQKTSAIGTCVDFWYAMDGLSQDKLRILLRPPSVFLFGPAGPRNMTDEEFERRLMTSDGRDDIVLWEHRDSTQSKWINGQVVYDFNNRHMIIFEGLPISISDPNRAYRGYISVDTMKFIDASICKPFCNFGGGLCSWSQDTNDDFDWSLSHGSTDTSTGPRMDRFSFNYGVKEGGYAFIDSQYPRRPRDKARLLSEVFSPPEADSPLCMRFWTHMFGNGIGALRVIIAPTGAEEEIIWELKGEQGNNWYQGQFTITATSDFQIVIEAEVGSNNLGDIAIDEIALKENPCPTSPQSASKFQGDCTFEVDECGWRNVEVRQRMDELDWERTIASQARAPSRDHTLQTSQGSFLSLPRTSVQRGERGWLISNAMEPTKSPICLSFWYFIHDPFIEATGPSLGALRVILMEQDQQGFQTLTPLWKLSNQQGPIWKYGQTSISTDKTFMILFEGLWGNARGSEYMAIDDITYFKSKCTNIPEKSTVSFLDCDFTRDSCSYMNASSGGNERWLRSSISRRPSTLADHTYGGPIGYLYFEVFNINNNNPPRVTLMSRVVPASGNSDPVCLSFWFAPIGNDPDTKLTINREVVDTTANDAESQPGTPLMIWNVPASAVFTDRIEWMFGEVEVQTDTDFKISFVGEAKKGGFAIDDILVYPGGCESTPSQDEEQLPNKK